MPSISGKKLAHWRKEAKKQGISAKVPPAEVDWLLQAVTDLDSLSLRLESFQQRAQIPCRYSPSQLTQLWQRRLKERLPLQYLVGNVPWRNFSLTVSPAVLIPRPETELIVDIARQAAAESTLPDLAAGHWVDLGTGSGAIACGLAAAFIDATIHAVDQSAAALAIAQENAENLQFFPRINFYQGFWWNPLAAWRGAISGMVSNPPYIPTPLIATLQPEIALHEPHLALDGGNDGLDCIRHLIATAPDYLRPGGIWLIEMMAGQAETVKNLLQEQGSYEKIQIFPDLAGIERFALAYNLN
jgi:release factor glutamine methyltransferase